MARRVRTHHLSGLPSRTEERMLVASSCSGWLDWHGRRALIRAWVEQSAVARRRDCDTGHAARGHELPGVLRERPARRGACGGADA